VDYRADPDVSSWGKDVIVIVDFGNPNGSSFEEIRDCIIHFEKMIGIS
jgi:hypothetical protein